MLKLKFGDVVSSPFGGGFIKGVVVKVGEAVSLVALDNGVLKLIAHSQLEFISSQDVNLPPSAEFDPAKFADVCNEVALLREHQKQNREQVESLTRLYHESESINARLTEQVDNLSRASAQKSASESTPAPEAYPATS